MNQPLKRKRLLAVASCAALLTSSAIAANIAGNGGFEIAGTGGPLDSDQWVETAGGPTASTQSVRGGPPAAGLFSHELLAFGSQAAGASAVVTQNSITDVGLPSLLGGSTLSATFDHSSILGPGGVAFVELKILDGVGGIVGTSGLIPLANTTAATTFMANSIPAINVPAFGASPNDTYASFLEFSAAAGAFDGSFANVWIDNVVITGTVVPEPGSSALLGLGILGLLRRRRR